MRHQDTKAEASLPGLPAEKKFQKSVPEQELADRLGLPRDLIRHLRKSGGAVEGVHWVRDGQKVLWDEERAKWVFEQLVGPHEERVGEIIEAMPPSNDNPVENALVLRLPLNPRVVLAGLGGQVIRVRVRDNRNFVAGMQIAVKKVHTDLYDHAGRLPRWRGKY